MLFSRSIPKWKQAFIISLFGFLATTMTIVGFSPLLPNIQEHFAITYSQLGLFSGMTGIIAIIAGIPLGLFNRRFGLKKAVIIGMLFMSSGMAVVTIANNYYVLISGRVFWVLGIQMSYIAFMAIFNTIAPRSSNAKIMTIAYCANNVAAMVGAPVGGVFADSFNWRVSMLFFIAVTLAMVVILAFFLKVEKAPAKDDDSAAQQLQRATKLKILIKNPILLYLGILTCIIIFPPYQEYIPSVLEGVGFDALARGNIFMWAYLIGIPALIFAGFLADKFTPRKILIIILLLFTVVTPLLNMDSRLVVIFSSVFLLALSSIPVSLAYTIPGLLFKKEDMGFVMGVVQAIGASGSYFGPQISGMLRDHLGSFSLVWDINAALNLLACIMLLLLAGEIERRRHKLDLLRSAAKDKEE